MRAVIQRVLQGSVTVNGEVVGQIGRGFVVLIGIGTTDEASDADYIVKKILNLRLWEDPESEKPWSKSVMDMQYEILCISQFTLHAQTAKGNKPDFHNAMGGATAEPFYHETVEKIRKAYQAEKIQLGRFGAMMAVNLTNDGPVTIAVDSKDKK